MIIALGEGMKQTRTKEGKRMRVTKETLKRWDKYCNLLCHEHNTRKEDISSLGTAWAIAHKLDIPKEGYHLGLNDNHIETALRRIFPNVSL